ncbi:putative lipid II flippase FtsW [Halarsenatibacter silvermanii]|uniref:Cell division protein FtsW n=1 Tax=Halarsenatibacter silvermanii TaxID=321763 RepID=A0A1G9JN81_9FIRM|nr:putative lipid II flippase FtsW [Halarsenatibacter silvermanii]SDL38762.1 cell division protein FtsW [Halarsenatibacter silvermanii]
MENFNRAEKEKQNDYERSSIDKILVLTVLMLLSFGLIMILSASSIKSMQDYGDIYFFFRRQLKFAGAGLAVMFLLSQLDYHFYLRHSRKIVFFSLFLLLAVYLPGLGVAAGGSRRWIDLGFINFQPSEFTKLAAVIYLSSFIYRKKNFIKSFWKGVFPPMIIISAMFFLVTNQPDLGTGVAIFATSLLLLIIGGMKFSHLLVIGLPGSLILIYYLTAASYRVERLTSFVDPWSEPRGAGYHVIQSILAIGSGGLTGLGPGNSLQKFFYLPEPATDFIFAVIGEELGFIGAFILILLFILLTYRGIVIALGAPDLFGSMLAVGITVMISLQIFINIGAATALMPVTGITLPFISYGGSSLLIMMSSIGILLSISRFESVEDVKK